MRAATQKKIDACHAEIARLVAMEKSYWNEHEPEPNALLRSVRETRLDCAAWSPTMKANARWATATLPVLGEGNARVATKEQT